DRISYREIQVKDLDADDLPVNVESPEVGGSGRVGKALNCGRGDWENTRHADYWVTWYRSNRIGPDHPRYRAPSQVDLGSFTTPAEAEYGTQDLTWLDSLIVGHGKKYTPTAADVGKVIHCAVSADNGGATVWETARAREIRPAR
ncbi:MAG TPA: hypothetical protein VK631_28710, partial [Solirubrobacteraceae bacterium]|nr:hypothetical protein [Solirubrobacteraceae bacterium]